MHARRFLASQAVMLSLRGIPRVYFHSLVGTRNDLAGVEASGQPRRINRRRFHRAELDLQLQQRDRLANRVFSGYRRLLHERIRQSAFHPAARQEVEVAADPRLLSYRRTAVDDSVEVLVGWNASRQRVTWSVPPPRLGSWQRDLISGQAIGNQCILEPAQVVWIECRA